MAETKDEVLEIPADEVAVAGGGELEYAGFWSRVAALIVDNAIVTIFGLALLIAAAFVGGGAVMIANLAYLLIAILYWPLMECSERQATIGKQLLGPTGVLPAVRCWITRAGAGILKSSSC